MVIEMTEDWVSFPVLSQEASLQEDLSHLARSCILGISSHY